MKKELKKGAIIEVKVPNVEKPIKAVVLDIIEFDITDNDIFNMLCTEKTI